MGLRVEVDLTSYDRLFPSQDFVPQKGFGNLIALPLQGRSRKQGNTVFLDPATMEPWPDQWAFLASVRRLPVGEAKVIGDAIRVAAGPGSAEPAGIARSGTVRAHFSAGGDGHAWGDAGHRQDRPSPGTSRIAQAPRIGAQPGVPPARAVTALDLEHPADGPLLRGGHRPALRPRGLLDDAARVVEAAGSRLEVGDRRPAAATTPFTFTGELSSAQEDAVAEMAQHDLGVLVAPQRGRERRSWPVPSSPGSPRPLSFSCIPGPWPNNGASGSATCLAYRSGTSASSAPGVRGVAA